MQTPQHLSTSRPHVITLARRGATLELDFSHSSEKNAPKKISPRWNLLLAFLICSWHCFFLHWHPTLKTEGIPSHMELFQRAKYRFLAICVGIPRAGWWNSPLIFTNQTTNIFQNASISSEAQLMKEIRLTCLWVACSHDLEGFFTHPRWLTGCLNHQQYHQVQSFMALM